MGWDAFGKERFGSGRVLGSVGRWQTPSEASGNDLEGSGFDVFSFTRTSEVRLLVMNGSGESVLEGPLLVFRKRKVPRDLFLRFRKIPGRFQRLGGGKFERLQTGRPPRCLGMPAG